MGNNETFSRFVRAIKKVFMFLDMKFLQLLIVSKLIIKHSEGMRVRKKRERERETT